MLRQVNAGENKAVEARCQSSDWQLDVTFEYTARSTPQQNSPVETGFTVVGLLVLLEALPFRKARRSPAPEPRVSRRGDEARLH